MNTRSFVLILITIVLLLTSGGCHLLKHTDRTPTQAQNCPLSEKQLMPKEKTNDTKADVFLETLQNTTLDGRDDPFCLLPEEKVKDMVSLKPITSQPIGKNSSNNINLKGIIITDQPSALIELEGTYYRVKVGESIKGDLIVAIDEDSLVIQRAGTLLTIDMGE
jgi:Tfp pilus assembly protein PilP